MGEGTLRSILVTGSGATSEVLELGRPLRREDERIRILDLPSSPVSTAAARARALSEARSDRIFILQDDDLWFPDHVEILGALDASRLLHQEALAVIVVDAVETELHADIAREGDGGVSPQHVPFARIEEGETSLAGRGDRLDLARIS